MSQNALVWFRQDLRCHDNPALNLAAQSDSVLAVYIHDTHTTDRIEMGEASRWWLQQSLDALSQSLDQKLGFFAGEPLSILTSLCQQHSIDTVFWNRCYEPWQIQRDKHIKAQLSESGIEVKTTNGSLLWEPWTVTKKDGTPYKVFTPFYKKSCLPAPPPREPQAKPRRLKLISTASGQSLDSLGLLPEHHWHAKLCNHWQPGEQQALKQLKSFIKKGLNQYKKGRDFPSLQAVSRLSPHIHFGEISPHQIYAAIHADGASDNHEHFIRELAWREFSYHLLYYFPTLPKQNLNRQFDAFPWSKDETWLHAWQRGKTGYPIVDAGMRELWQTGYMHNRVRMIVGSFLVKNLCQHWLAGEEWFWDCLVDADLANNSASWQWVAGCGADAAPYFRVFNPVLQAQKFDPDGLYIKHFVPELKKLAPPNLFNPGLASADELKKAGIVLGETYPYPIVDLKESREAALSAYATIKK